MSNANRLRSLADKCAELANIAPTDAVKQRQLELAASYRRLATREDWLEQHSFGLPTEATVPLAPE